MCNKHLVLFSLFIFSLLFLNACARVQNDGVLLSEQVSEKETESQKREEAKESKKAKDAKEDKDTKKNKDDIQQEPTYTYEFIVEDFELLPSQKSNESNDTDKQKSPREKNDEKLLLEEEKALLKIKMIKLLKNNSQLEFLKNKKLDSLVALERRARGDSANAVEVMKAFGFYSSSATFKIDKNANPYHVFIYLNPKQQYLVDTIKMEYAQTSVIPKEFLDQEKKTGFLYKKRVKSYTFDFPKSLPLVEKGDKAIASDILTAVNGLSQGFRENGFPQARVVSSAYTVNKNQHSLDGRVFINPGFPALMGKVIVAGNEKVSSKYIEALRPWKSGEIWDDRKLLEYRSLLQKTGLFQNVDLKFDKKAYADYRKEVRKHKRAINKQSKNKDALGKDRLAKDALNKNALAPVSLPVSIAVQESTARSFSGSVFYSTDQGPGINTAWEHRNFFGNGERLRLSMPLMKDETLFSAEFKKPAFIFPKQSFILKGSGGYEKTDAYEKNYIDVAVGLEREIRKDWWIESLIHVDKVEPKNDDDELPYNSIRWVNTVRYDKRNDKKNPTEGFVSLVRVSPLFGYDEEDFYSLATEFDTSVYHTLSDRVVLALRLGLGVMPGSGEGSIPRTKHFFLGGGGTVRGFSYQELGPHDKDGDPFGGLSYTLMNFETRIKITKEIGIVPFIDAGMVYDETTPEWGQKLAWGAGIGLRYITPVGPVRFDIAVPLTGPNQHSKKSFTDFQMYISIGQAF